MVGFIQCTMAFLAVELVKAEPLKLSYIGQVMFYLKVTRALGKVHGTR